MSVHFPFIEPSQQEREHIESFNFIKTTVTNAVKESNVDMLEKLQKRASKSPKIVEEEIFKYGYRICLEYAVVGTWKWYIDSKYWPVVSSTRDFAPFVKQKVFQYFAKKRTASERMINQIYEDTDGNLGLSFFRDVFISKEFIIRSWLDSGGEVYKQNILATISCLNNKDSIMVFLDDWYSIFLTLNVTERNEVSFGIELNEMVLSIVTNLPEPARTKMLSNLLATEASACRTNKYVYTNFARIMKVFNESCDKQGKKYIDVDNQLPRILVVLFNAETNIGDDKTVELVRELDLVKKGHDIPVIFFEKICGVGRELDLQRLDANNFDIVRGILNGSLSEWAPTGGDLDQILSSLASLQQNVNLKYSGNDLLDQMKTYMEHFFDAAFDAVINNPKCVLTEAYLKDKLMILTTEMAKKNRAQLLQQLSMRKVANTWLRKLPLGKIDQQQKNLFSTNMDLFPAWKEKEDEANLLAKKAEVELDQLLKSEPVTAPPQKTTQRKKGGQKKPPRRSEGGSSEGGSSDGASDGRDPEPAPVAPPTPAGSEQPPPTPEMQAAINAADAADAASHAANRLSQIQSLQAQTNAAQARDRAAQEARSAAAAAAAAAAAEQERAQQEQQLRNEECGWKDIRSDLMYIHENKDKILRSEMYRINFLPQDTRSNWMTAMLNSRKQTLVDAVERYRTYQQRLPALPSGQTRAEFNPRSKFDMLLFLRNADQHNNLNLTDYVNCKFLKEAQALLNFAPLAKNIAIIPIGS